MISRIWCGWLVATVSAFQPVGYGFGNSEATPSTAEIVKRLQAADAVRQPSFKGYVGTRVYNIENGRFHVKATMRVEVTAAPSGSKTFRVLEMTGPGPVRKMAFQRMLDTEARSSAPLEQASTRISPDNYEFELASVVNEDSRSCFVLSVTPKTANPLLFRGKVWVDSVDYAVVRIEGSPAQSPSFWVRKTRFEHQYKKYGQFWLAESNRSESEIRVFGNTKVTIDYLEYRLGSSSSGTHGGSQ